MGGPQSIDLTPKSKGGTCHCQRWFVQSLVALLRPTVSYFCFVPKLPPPPPPRKLQLLESEGNFRTFPVIPESNSHFEIFPILATCDAICGWEHIYYMRGIRTNREWTGRSLGSGRRTRDSLHVRCLRQDWKNIQSRGRLWKRNCVLSSDTQMEQLSTVSYSTRPSHERQIRD